MHHLPDSHRHSGQAQAAVTHLVEHAVRCDPDGISLYFFSGTFDKHENMSSADDVMALFHTHQPGGGTKLAKVCAPFSIISSSALVYFQSKSFASVSPVTFYFISILPNCRLSKSGARGRRQARLVRAERIATPRDDSRHHRRRAERQVRGRKGDYQCDEKVHAARRGPVNHIYSNWRRCGRHCVAYRYAEWRGACWFGPIHMHAIRLAQGRATYIIFLSMLSVNILGMHYSCFQNWTTACRRVALALTASTR